MPEEAQNFATARARLDEIVAQVRKKDTSLEASLDLLEEGVRLANQCTELIDHADWEAGQSPADSGDDPNRSVNVDEADASNAVAVASGSAEAPPSAEYDEASASPDNSIETPDAGD